MMDDDESGLLTLEGTNLDQTGNTAITSTGIGEAFLTQLVKVRVER